jgi:hypothetical protein
VIELAEVALKTKALFVVVATARLLREERLLASASG